MLLTAPLRRSGEPTEDEGTRRGRILSLTESLYVVLSGIYLRSYPLNII